MTALAQNVAGCVLAGGLARRMGGGDKTLKKLSGRPMLAHVIERLSPQVRCVMLNANGDPARFSDFGLPVAADPIEGFAGPLAGVLAGLEWAKANEPDAEFVVSVAGDTPFFPEDLVARLLSSGLSPGEIVLARSDEGTHPVFGLWPVSVASDLRDFLENGDTRKVLAFVDRHPNRSAHFEAARSDAATFDPFFNINTPEELETAEALYRGKAA
ncbi:molybdenum cofactor guanylyltransferase MobA [Stappia sp. GBMRC 2046]|uniref:Molybdenum cofactor guanylyltransferase n=1 Tax=Stappia sediminis TaxID=2692190 RepID=A0A7X3LYG6_9HYPH|nr:molybdenum cofactor guanylyltransferase MobA [Stappia sediminis]MXN67400.1 molybdenum cofactor guanylyltransferase MobA [Stappia sediminis]